MPGKIVESLQAPAPIGPYSQAMESGDIVFCSGQIGLDPKTGQLAPTLEAQTELLLNNMESVLQAAGLGFRNIVKTTIFLTDMAAFATVNAIYERRMGGHRPARSTVAVSGLPKAALVEIECIAVR